MKQEIDIRNRKIIHAVNYDFLLVEIGEENKRKGAMPPCFSGHANWALCKIIPTNKKLKIKSKNDE